MKKLFLFLLLCVMCADASAQQKITIKGTVTDENHAPLVGVYVTNGKVGAQSDRDGHFMLRVSERGQMKLSTMYYSLYNSEAKLINLQRDTTINFVLKEDALNMDEVVITGTRTPKRLSETPVQTTVIKDREIRMAGSVSTMETLIDNVPGIVSTPNAMGNNLRIKGLNTRYILFLVDGERMVSEGAGGNINLDQIDVNTIDHIEMINGASSALYGSNAVGAVINIITKKPQHKFEAGVEQIVESNNTWKTKVNIGSTLKKFTTRASAFRHSTDGFKAAYSTARYTDWGANLKFGYRPMERLDITLNGRYFRHETFNPAGSLNRTHDLTHTLALGLSTGYISRDHRNSMRLSVNWDKYFDYVVGNTGSYKHLKNTADYISTRFTDTFKANERFELVGGLEYNHENVYATTTLGSSPKDKSIEDVNLFAQAQWEVFKNFDIVAGARYTYNNAFKSAFTPKLSLMYEVGKFKFRGGVGSAFRAPSIKELYYDFNHQGMFWMHGNPDLNAEKGLYTSLSAEFTTKNFNASISGYYNNIDNKITQFDVYREDDPSGIDNHKYYKNVSSATLKGFDVNFSWIFLKELTLKATYGFCDARDNATGLQLGSNVKHSLTTSLTWNGKIARSPFSLQLSGRVHSPILDQWVEKDDASGVEQVMKEQTKSYNIWKITLVKPFRVKKHTFELTFKCDNLFGFKDKFFVNPGRQYMFGLRYAFK